MNFPEVLQRIAVAGILKIQRSSLNRSYLEHWIHELGLEKEWEDALRAANISDLSISPQ
jgi:hypothetical protein